MRYQNNGEIKGRNVQQLERQIMSLNALWYSTLPDLKELSVGNEGAANEKAVPGESALQKVCGERTTAREQMFDASGEREKR